MAGVVVCVESDEPSLNFVCGKVVGRRCDASVVNRRMDVIDM
jgi:hypothetical protein